MPSISELSRTWGRCKRYKVPVHSPPSSYSSQAKLSSPNHQLQYRHHHCTHDTLPCDLLHPIQFGSGKPRGDTVSAPRPIHQQPHPRERAHAVQSVSPSSRLRRLLRPPPSKNATALTLTLNSTGPPYGPQADGPRCQDFAPRAATKGAQQSRSTTSPCLAHHQLALVHRISGGKFRLWGLSLPPAV
jgi:hypothetical protein